MRIQVLGDSFGLPRTYKSSNEIEIHYEDTYPEQLRQLLKKEFYDEDILVINSSKRFNNSFFLIKNEISEIYLYQPEYIVIQVGIVDCWTRENGIYICEEFKNKSPWISEEEYILYLKTLIENSFKLISDIKGIIIVNITKATKEQYEKHPGSFERTKAYNKHLNDLGQYDNVYIANVYQKFDENEKPATSSDGVHPSALGNSMIAEEIFENIRLCHYYNKAKDFFLKEDFTSSLELFNKICTSKASNDKLYWEAFLYLVQIYITSEKLIEAFRVLFSEIENSDKPRFIQAVDCIYSKLMKNGIIYFAEIKDYYLQFIDLLIKMNKIDNFNSLVAEFVRYYDYNCYEKHGSIMLKYGLDELATESYVKAIEQGTSNPESYMYIAKKFYEINEYDDALNFCLDALKLSPQNTEACNLISKLCKLKEDYSKIDEIKEILNRQ